MNFKVMAVIVAVVAALSIPVLVAANSSGFAAGTQERAAVGTCVSSGDCTQDQLRLRDGSCGGDAVQDQVQLRTQNRLQTRECAQDQQRDQTCVNGGECTQDRLRTRSHDQTCDGAQDQTRTQQRLQTCK